MDDSNKLSDINPIILPLPNGIPHTNGTIATICSNERGQFGIQWIFPSGAIYSRYSRNGAVISSYSFNGKIYNRVSVKRLRKLIWINDPWC